jgi:hypothetical protein
LRAALALDLGFGLGVDLAVFFAFVFAVPLFALADFALFFFFG